MKRITILNFILATVLLSVISCSHKKKETGSNEKTASKHILFNIDTSFLEDKNYVYHNVDNTESIKFIGRRLPNGNFDYHLYTDSTFKRHYIELTPNQRAQLTQKFFSKLMKVDSSYAVNQITAYFVSKQRKLGNLQPLLIRLAGDDYGSLTLIVLDKDNKYLSGYNVSGGFNSGPDEQGDSLETYETRSYSHLKNNRISTYYIYETDPMDTVKTTALIDSNAFESIIGANGSITTRQIGEVHYIIPYKDNIKRKK